MAKQTYEEQMKDYNSSVESRKKRMEHYGVSEYDVSYKPTGRQIDEWLKEDLRTTVDFALRNCNLVRQQLIHEPMVVYGPLFWKTPGIPDYDIVISKDKIDNLLRFSCYQIVVIFLTETQLLWFTTNFNFLRGQYAQHDSTYVGYDKVVSIGTTTMPVDHLLPDGQPLKALKMLKVTMASRDELVIAVDSSQIHDLFSADPKLDSYDRTIRALNEIINSKQR